MHFSAYFFSAYFVTSVSEISNNLNKKGSMDEEPKSLSECICLLTKYSILLVKIYIAISLPESESSKIDVKLKFANSVSVCFISFYMLSAVAGAFRGFNHSTIRSLLCLCGLHQNFSIVGPSTFTRSKWIKSSSFNRFSS